MVGAYVMQQATGFLVELIGGAAGYQAVFGWIILSLLAGAWFYRVVPDARPRS
jgi:hypothetical protein